MNIQQVSVNRSLKRENRGRCNRSSSAAGVAAKNSARKEENMGSRMAALVLITTKHPCTALESLKNNTEFGAM